MLREMLIGKLHRGSVTECRIDYEGSLTVDQDLIDAAGMLLHQKVQVLDIDNGARIETYLIAGERGSRHIMVNGAAARLFHKGDRVIVCAYGICDETEARTLVPKVVLLDAANNQI
ncbi:MAG TPA: aspartate 1-decarboxylase [Planctomycetes bacterium]|nr:aspartate 1-decarboxylase [Planctomycetota bacterium]